jgi:hypothetical protein
MIYCRNRIVSALYSKNPDEYINLTTADIKSISLQGDQVCCEMEDYKVLVRRADLIQNFWEHRTRVPSFFEYKIWKKYGTKDGIPVGAVDYGVDSITGTLDTKSGRIPKVATDKDGVEKVYFVNEHTQSCTCGAWQQLNLNREEFEKEFDKYSDIKFFPVCKHLSWTNANIRLSTFKFLAKSKEGRFNPHICVYWYDYRTQTLKYRITNDGVRANTQWIPVDGWKEKHLYDTNGMPTGECWKTLEGALSCKTPYKLVPYSASLQAAFNRTGSR